MTRAMRGQAMAEYLIVLTLVTVLVAVPIDGHSSAVALMLDAVHVAWGKFITALALAA